MWLYVLAGFWFVVCGLVLWIRVVLRCLFNSVGYLSFLWYGFLDVILCVA